MGVKKAIVINSDAPLLRGTLNSSYWLTKLGFLKEPAGPFLINRLTFLLRVIDVVLFIELSPIHHLLNELNNIATRPSDAEAETSRRYKTTTMWKM